MVRLDLSRAGMLQRDQKSISASWQRCFHEHGLDKRQRRHETVIRRERVRDSIESLGPLFAACRSQVEHIFQNIVGSGHAVILTDKGGTIIDFSLQSSLDALFRQAGLRRGADWSEHHEGTNGIGTAIREKKSLTVYRDQHFHSDHASLTCTGAPIFDVKGDVLGLFDVSSVGRKDDVEMVAHTRALLEMSARLISRRNFQDHFSDQWVIRFHRDAERVGLLEEGLLALDHDGVVIAADQQALSHLALEDRQSLVGQSIEHVFEMDRDRLASTLSEGGVQAASVGVGDAFRSQGATMHARLVEPRQSGRVSNVRGRSRLVPKKQKLSDWRAGASRAVPSSVVGKAGTGEDKLGRFTSRLGQDQAVLDIAAKALKLYENDIPLLLTGETGAGKDSFARALHDVADRGKGPYVTVNCAALPENMIEGELFGYKAGAFTGAQSGGFQGRFLAANGGTLLLDEIGDMPLSAQTRLLQVLEQRQVTPLGSSETIALDIRLISATHQPLEDLVEQGRFREDLFYRICGFTVPLPALRERDDLTHLVASLLPESPCGRRVRVAPCARDLMADYPWPGNIRQLKNVLRTASILAEDEPLQAHHLHLPHFVKMDGEGDRQPSHLSNDVRDQERKSIEAMLITCKWNVSQTAQRLGLSRNTLYRKMKALGLKRVS